jgi:hypothetical protein
MNENEGEKKNARPTQAKGTEQNESNSRGAGREDQ